MPLLLILIIIVIILQIGAQCKWRSGKNEVLSARQDADQLAHLTRGVENGETGSNGAGLQRPCRLVRQRRAVKPRAKRKALPGKSGSGFLHILPFEQKRHHAGLRRSMKDPHARHRFQLGNQKLREHLFVRGNL